MSALPLLLHANYWFRAWVAQARAVHAARFGGMVVKKAPFMSMRLIQGCCLCAPHVSVQAWGLWTLTLTPRMPLRMPARWQPPSKAACLSQPCHSRGCLRA